MDTWLIIDRERKNLLQELAHIIIKAEKSYGLPSAGWRTGRAGHSVIQFKSEGLRITKASVWGQENVPVSAGRVFPSSTSVFYAGPWQIAWCPQWGGQTLLTWSMDSNTDLFQKHTQKQSLPAIWASLSPVKWT